MTVLWSSVISELDSLTQRNSSAVLPLKCSCSVAADSVPRVAGGKWINNYPGYYIRLQYLCV